MRANLIRLCLTLVVVVMAGVGKMSAAHAQYPRFTSSAIADAEKRNLIRYFTQSGIHATNSAEFGSTYVVLAYSSFIGNLSTDARLLQGIRYTIQAGNEPAGTGGYISQHELRFAVAVAIAKKTPRVWGRLSAREIAKIDHIMKAISVGNAYSCSSENPDIKRRVELARNIVGNQMWWRGNPNFSNACPASVMTGRLYFGTEFNDILQNFKKAAFATQAQALDLPRIYEAYRTNGPRGPVGVRPTTSEVENAVKNWRWARNGQGADAYFTNSTEMVNFSFNRVVEAGLNGGRGILYKGAYRGKIMANASGLPNKGKLGMANELDATDAGGARSAMSYTVKGTRIVLDFLTLLATTNPAANANLSAALNRMQIGMVDIRYKSDNGYYSYSKGGGTSNNETWKPNDYHRLWAMESTLSQWFDVVAELYNVKN